MSLELTITIPDNSPQEYNINAVAEAEHISREEAVLRLLDVPRRTSKATPEALAILGAFSSPEDVALMDEVMEIVHRERDRQAVEGPRV